MVGLGTCHYRVAAQEVRGRARVEEEQVGERAPAIDGAGHTVEAETAEAKDQGLEDAPRVVVANDHDVPAPGGRGFALREPRRLREDEVGGRVRHLRARGAQAEDLLAEHRSQRTLLRAFLTKPALEVDHPFREREEILCAAREIRRSDSERPSSNVRTLARFSLSVARRLAGVASCAAASPPMKDTTPSARTDSSRSLTFHLLREEPSLTEHPGARPAMSAVRGQGRAPGRRSWAARLC